MKELLNAIKYTIICQLVCWGIFILCDEIKYIPQSEAESLAGYSGLAILIILLVCYFIYSDKYIERNNLNSKKFNIFLFFLWSITSILMMYGLFFLVDNEILHICQGTGWECFLNGFEYIIQGCFMVATAVLILIIKIIIALYKHITKSKRTIT